MSRTGFRLGASLAAIALFLQAFRVAVHGALVLDDTLQGSTIGTRSGGSFVTGGWQANTKDDTIYWHVATITNGAAEFDVRGLYANECRTGNEDKTELWHMYDNT